MIPRPIRIAVFLAACAVIVWLSVAPTTAIPSVNMWDKLEHAGAYVGLALIGAWAFRSRSWRLALGLFALGVGVEIAQATMGWGRQGDVLDAVANSVGIGLGLLAARVIGELPMVKSPARGE
jgi:VanZ family protein